MIYKRRDVEALNALSTLPHQKTHGIFTLAAPPLVAGDEPEQQVRHEGHQLDEHAQNDPILATKAAERRERGNAHVQVEAAVARSARLSPPCVPARMPSQP